MYSTKSRRRKSMRKQTSNRKIARQKLSGKCQKAKDCSVSPQGRKRHKQNFSNTECPHAQPDRRTAENVPNIVREVKDPSRMLQRVSIVMSEQKQLRVFNEFASCSVSDGSGPNKNFIAIRSSSGEPYPSTNAVRAPKNGR